jgi:hypothetical protein
VLDPNSDFVRLGEVRADADADAVIASRSQRAAAGLTVRRGGEGREVRQQVRFTDCGTQERAAVLRLDPIRDRQEYGALIDVPEGGLASSVSRSP